MVQLVDSLDLSTNVELLDGLVQVDNGRVLNVTTEDELSLLGPKSGEIPRQHAPLEHEPLWLFDCVRMRSMRHQPSQIPLSSCTFVDEKKEKATANLHMRDWIGSATRKINQRSKLTCRDGRCRQWSG